MDKEKWYIRKRKMQAWLHSLQFYLCRMFPVHENRIVFCTFEGRGGFGCNPKYVAIELHKRMPEAEMIWLVNDMSKEFPPYIRKKPNTNWSRAYWLSTAKVWVDNYRTRYGTKKRKKQYYLNTNHYTCGIKCTGLWRGTGFSEMAYLVSKADSDMIDDLLIDSDWCEKVMPKAMIFERELYKSGAPRTDVLFHDRVNRRKALRKKHHLDGDVKIVLFAPTFREGARDGKRYIYSEECSLDFDLLLDSMEKRFGGRWYLCTRMHPQLAALQRNGTEETGTGRIIDESFSDDMYEILAGADAYISDYSSACFEAGLAGIPTFLYADDIDQYRNDRGALYWDLTTAKSGIVKNNPAMIPDMDLQFPFPIATCNTELKTIIEEYDEIRYQQMLAAFWTEIKQVYDGKASKRVVTRIMERLAS